MLKDCNLSYIENVSKLLQFNIIFGMLKIRNIWQYPV
jgi:hypothetical protein